MDLRPVISLGDGSAHATRLLIDGICNHRRRWWDGDLRGQDGSTTRDLFGWLPNESIGRRIRVGSERGLAWSRVRHVVSLRLFCGRSGLAPRFFGRRHCLFIRFDRVGNLLGNSLDRGSRGTAQTFVVLVQ